MGVEGYYLTCDDAVCKECANSLPDLPVHERVNPEYPWWRGFESWADPLVIFSDDESDTPTHCVECGVVIEHDLTDDGYRYIMEAVLDGFSNGEQSPVVIQWLDAYEEYMQGRDDEIECEHGALDWDDPMTLYRLLPHDTTWQESGDMKVRQHAYLAGWIDNVTN